MGGNRHTRRACCGLGAALLALASRAPAQPVAYVPALAIADPSLVAVSVTGSGFGPPGAGSQAEVTTGASVLTIASTDRAVLRWTDRQVVVKVAPTVTSAAVKIRVGGVASASVPARFYVHDWFETDRPLEVGTNPSPLAIAVDRRSRVWLNEEFHRSFKMVDLRSGAVTRYDYPRPADTSRLFCGGGTAAGEDVIVDRGGRIWLTEFGIGCNDPTKADHSRIVVFDPRRGVSSANPRVFNLPGDRQGVVGAAYDRRRRRIWFGETRGALAAGLGSFSADSPMWSNSFDFPTSGLACNALCSNAPARTCATVNDCQFCQGDGTCNDPPGKTCGADADCHGTCQKAPGAVIGACSNLGRFCGSDAQCVVDPAIVCGLCSNVPDRPCGSVHQCVLVDEVCAAGATDESMCVGEEREPDFHTFQPGHVVVDRRGIVWYTAYWIGNSLRRLDPATGLFTNFPLPPASAMNTLSPFGSWPWQIQLARDGDLVTTEYADSTLSRLDVTRVANPMFDCTALDASGHNPCIDEMPIPGADPVTQNVHSVVFDRSQNAWFGQGGLYDDPADPSTVGFVSADWTHVVLFPPLSLFPFTSHGSECVVAGGFVGFSGAGIAYDPRTRAVLVADYCRKRIVRLRPV